MLRPKKDLRRTLKNSIKKAGILAMGGYRAMISEELKRQVQAMRKEHTMRGPDDIELLLKLRHMNFLAVLPEAALRRTVARLQCTVLPANAVVVEEAEQGADKMYMIIAGSVGVYRTHLLHKDLMEHVGDLGKLEHFGDEALVLGSSERPFTVETREETVFCTLSRVDYEACCKRDFERGVVRKVLALRSLPLFFGDSLAALIAMSYATDLHVHSRGDVPVVEDKRPPRMYVLMEGQIGVSMLLYLPGPDDSAEMQPVRVRFATLTAGMPFGAESILVATDRERASKGLNPREATSRFTYTIESATATTVSFSSEQFVRRTSKSALRWLKSFHEETVGIKEIRKHAKRAGSWQQHRGNAKALADGQVAETKPFREAMNAEMFRTKMVAEGIQLPRLHSPARYHKKDSHNPRQRLRQQQQEAQRSQSTDSALDSADKLDLHEQLVQLPLDQGYGPGRVGIDMDKALELVYAAKDLDLETKLRHIDIAEAVLREQEYVPPPDEIGWMTEALQGDLLQAELDMYDTQDLRGLPIDQTEKDSRDEFLKLKTALSVDSEARVRHHQEMAEALRINVAQSEQMNLQFHKVHWDPFVQRGANAAKNRGTTDESDTHPNVAFSALEDSRGAPQVDEDMTSGVPRVSSRISISETERRRAVQTPLRKCLPGGGEQWEKVGYRESFLYGCMPTQFEWRVPIYARSPQQKRYKTPSSGSVTSSGQLSRGGSMSLFTTAASQAQTTSSDSHGSGPISEINIDDRIRFHRAALTDATKEAALLVATLRPASTSTSGEDGGCGWLRYLHIVHSEWQRVAEAAKFHIFHLGRGDFGLVSGIPGTGTAVVPPTGKEVAAEVAEAAIALRDAKDALDTRREGQLGPDGELLAALPAHLRRFSTSSVRIALVLGTAVFRTAGQIPATSEPLHYQLQGTALQAAMALVARAPANAIVVGDAFREAVQYEFEVEPFLPGSATAALAQPDLEVAMEDATNEVDAQTQAAQAEMLAQNQAATVLKGRVADSSTFIREYTEEAQREPSASPVNTEGTSAHSVFQRAAVTHTADTIVGSPAGANSGSRSLSSPVPMRSSPFPSTTGAQPASPLVSRTPAAATERYKRMAANTRQIRGSPQRRQSLSGKESPASKHPRLVRRRMTHLGPMGGESPVPNLPELYGV